MKPDWAEENLQTIRALMERSAVYRRALAPIMIFAGLLGVAAAAIGVSLPINSFSGFLALWFSAAAFAIFGALVTARRQALKDKDAFWSPPTRRVAQALLPPLLAGMFVGIIFAFIAASFAAAFVVTSLWILFYGFALNAAGFFMPRSIKFFGWLFIASFCLLISGDAAGWINWENKANWLMGFFFGALHLAYGAYLYLTESKNPVA